MPATSTDNIRIVLLETSHPGNIGAAARAMKTMGLDRLTLVRPGDFPSAAATARAAGADDLLVNAVVVGSLAEAIGDCSLVVGTSARARSLEWPLLSPRECAAQVVAQAARAQAAVVFGRENSGMNNAELDLCHALVRIPSNPAFSSLNLGAAVQLIAYEVALAAAGGEPVPATEHVPAPAQEMQRLYEHLEAALVELDFLDPDKPKLLMRRLRRLFNRARPDPSEVQILRGILTAAQAAAKGKDPGQT